jgi:hypothetical protein
MTDNKETNILESNELVLTTTIDDEGNTKFIGGGFNINSYFLNDRISAITTFNNNNQNTDNVSSLFENLAIPAGLFYINQKIPKNNISNEEYYYKTHNTASDDMIDKLFGLVEANKKQKRQTKKHKLNPIKSNKTKTKKEKH